VTQCFNKKQETKKRKIWNTSMNTSHTARQSRAHGRFGDKKTNKQINNYIQMTIDTLLSIAAFAIVVVAVWVDFKTRKENED
jgi:hypothetical protein